MRLSKILNLFLIGIGLPILPVQAVMTIQGQIWDASNNTPAAGAYVQVDWAGSNTMNANSQGFYLFENIPFFPDHYFFVTKTGYADYRIGNPEYQDGQTNIRDADIYVGGLISGIVVEHANGILPGVSIWAENNELHSIAFYTSAADGSYSLRLAPGNCQVRAEAVDYAPMKEKRLQLGDKASLNLDLELYHGGSISGFVLSANPPGPLSGVEVNVRPSDVSWWPEQLTFTALDGSYTLEHVHPGDNDITALAPPGYANAYIRYIPVIDQQTTNNIIIELAAGGAIHGEVKDYLGQPVEQAQVQLYPASGNTADQQDMQTNTAGAYSFTGIRIGTFSLSIQPPQSTNLQIVQVSGITIAAGADWTRNFTLQPGGRLEGVVKDHLGQPLREAEILVSIELQYPFENVWSGIYTGTNGSYSVNGLSPYQNYAVVVHPPNTPQSVQNAMAVKKGVTVAEGETMQINFNLEEAGGRIGQVTDSQNMPITSGQALGINADIGNGQEFNNSEGNYTLLGFPSGQYLFILYPNPHLGNLQWGLTYIQVTANVVDNYNWQLSSGAILEGYVFDQSGNTLNGVRIKAVNRFDALSSFSQLVQASFSDSEGKYRLSGLSTGTYKVEVMPNLEAMNGLAPMTREFNLVAGQTQRRDFDLSGNSTRVFGTVRDPFGNRIPGALVYFWSDNSQVSAVTDQWGNYMLMLDTTIIYQTQAFYTSVLGTNLAVQPFINFDPNNPNHKKDFVMQTGGTITGVVTDQVGQPIFFATLRVYEESSPLPVRVAFTNSQGYYSVMGLHTGNFVVQASKDGYSSDQGNVGIALGSQVNGIRRILVAQDSIAGIVLSQRERRPIRQAVVQALQANTGALVQQTSTNKSGEYILRPLSNQAYQIKALATGRKSQILTGLYPGDRADFTLEPLIGQDEAISYPNPCRGNSLNFLYWLNQNAQVRIRVFNQAGELVWDWEGPGQGERYNKHTWNVSGVAPGVYLFKITLREENGATYSFPTGKLTVLK